MATVRKRTWRWIELPAAAMVAAIVAVLINTFVAQAFYIPSASMVPQLRVNDRVVVSKLAYHLHPPRRGDVVVFPAPPSEQPPSVAPTNSVTRVLRRIGRDLGVSESRTELIKRVVALPGETVAGREGSVFVNGQRLVEPYLPRGTVISDFGPVDVPAGRVWLMGDNRTNSSDSRVFGPIPISSIVGRAVWRVWPVAHGSFL